MAPTHAAHGTTAVTTPRHQRWSRVRPLGRRIRQAALGTGLAALALLAVPSPAGASPLQVDAGHFNGTVAQANWAGGNPTLGIGTLVNVEQSAKGTSVNVYQGTTTLDVDGNPTGYTDTLAYATSGFTYRIDSALLASARLTASGVPAVTRTYDADFTLLGESSTTIDIDVTWTGQGAIDRTVYHGPAEVFPGTVVFTGANAMSFRDASTTGTVSGLLPVGDSVGGYLLRTTQTRIITCVGARWDICFQQS